MPPHKHRKPKAGFFPWLLMFVDVVGLALGLGMPEVPALLRLPCVCLVGLSMRNLIWHFDFFDMGESRDG